MEDDQVICISEQEETDVKQRLTQGGIDLAKDFLDQKLTQWKEQPLNVAITGSAGTGKSSYINAVRNLKAEDDGAAAVDVTECTRVPTPYAHPHNDQLKFWDLPGVGTTNFPKGETYLSKVGFHKYDFFLIFSDSRFTEDDLWLAMQVQERGKNFLFVRTKVDADLRNDKYAHPNTFSEDVVLQRIRDYISGELAKIGFHEPKVFLISNFDQEKWDFPALCDQLIHDLPQLKREAMTLSLNAFSKNMVKEKKAILQQRVWKISALSAAGAIVPLPGVSVALDLALLTKETTFYKTQFGLDEAVLSDLSKKLKKKQDYLKVMLKSIGAISVQAAEKFIEKLLAKYATNMAIEEAVKIIPNVIGALIASAISFSSTALMLREVLDQMDKEACEVMDVMVRESVLD